MMNWDAIAIFGLLGLVSVFFQSKGDFRLIKMVNMLFYAGAVLFVANSFAAENLSSVYCLIGIVAANFLLSNVVVLRRKFVRLIPVSISVLGFLFLIKDTNITFLGEMNNLGGQLKFVLTGLLIALMAFDFGSLKLKILHKMVGGLEDQKLMQSIMIFMMAISYFLVGFGGGTFGIMLLGAAHLSSAFYREESDQISLPLSVLIVLPQLLYLAGADSPLLLSADVIEGLFLGTFSAYFLTQLWSGEKCSVPAIVLGYIVALALATGILLLATQYEKMGGADAFVAFLIGMILFETIKGKGYISLSLAGILLSISIFLLPKLENDDQKKLGKDMITLNGSDQSITWKKMEDLKGAYSILEDSSQIIFELKPKEGKGAKGVFKKVHGTISIAEQVENSTFDITLQMIHFTTNKKMRDESLFGKDYFNVAKYPTMHFKSSKLIAKNDGEYELHGQFTMIGETKDLTIQIRRPDLGDRKVLVGSGIIDRTQFGMNPSEVEGNIVEFNFQVELVQK